MLLFSAQLVGNFEAPNLNKGLLIWRPNAQALNPPRPFHLMGIGGANQNASGGLIEVNVEQISSVFAAPSERIVARLQRAPPISIGTCTTK